MSRDLGTSWNNCSPVSVEELRPVPGTIVRFEDGSEELVGRINTSGGLCDCCPETRLVIAWKRIWV